MVWAVWPFSTSMLSICRGVVNDETGVEFDPCRVKAAVGPVVVLKTEFDS